MKFRKSVCAALAFLAAPVGAAELGDDIGTAVAVTPTVNAELDAAVRPLSREEVVRFGEKVSTKIGGNATIAFDDDTRLYVSENSDLTIDEYVYADQSKFALQLRRGAVRLASGRMGGRNITIKTMVVSIGLRGTVLSLSADDARTVLFVEEGAVVAQVGAQTVQVNEGQGLVIDATGAGQPVAGWPAALNTAIATMSVSLATATAPSLAVPVEISGKLDPQAAQSAAQGLSSSDGDFSYD